MLDTKHEKFYQCQGDLGNLPPEFKYWRTLSEYRGEWHFLPSALRNRIAEQNLATDYLMSLEVWLQPISTIQEKQKIIYIQSLASIYEGVLSYSLRKRLEEEEQSSPLFKAVMDRKMFSDTGMTFGPTLKGSYAAGIIDDAWSSYFGYIREIRNWIHLSKEQKSQLMIWVRRQQYIDLRAKLNDFRAFIESNI